MKDKRFIDAIGDIDPDLIIEASNYKPRLVRQLSIAAIAACLALMLSLACVALVLNLNDGKTPPETTAATTLNQTINIPQTQKKTVVYYDDVEELSQVLPDGDISKYLVNENVAFSKNTGALRTESVSGELTDPSITNEKIQKAYEFLKNNLPSEVMTALEDSVEIVVNYDGDYYLKIEVSLKHFSNYTIGFYVNLKDIKA